MYIAGVEKQLDGSQVRAGMLRLLAGKPFDVGPTPMLDVFTELQNRENSIQLRGTMGLPSFDVGTGARNGRGALLCFDEFHMPYPQEQIYDAQMGTWTGNFTCYDGL